MNKLFTKIAASVLGLSMATGVGVAVASNQPAAKADAAGDELAFHFSGSSLATGTTYQAWSGSVSSSTTSKVSTATWQITVGNNSAQLGTNGKSSNLSKATLGNGSFTAASGLASALSITTTTQKYSAAICTTAMANIKRADLIFSGQNNTINKAWILSSTDGTSWEIEDSVTSGTISTGKSFTFTKNTDSRQYAFVGYWSATNSGGLKGFELKLYGEYDETGTITASADEAYSDESVTLTTNATSATWSITAGGSYAHLSSTSGKSVSLIGDAAGSVTVKAVASGYTDATKTITFNARPAGTYYTVSYTGLHGSLSNTESVLEGDPLDTYLVPAEHYHLPTAITVTAGGDELVADVDYDYDNESGEIQILEVTGDIVVSTSCIEDSKYTVTYVHGDHGTGDNYVVNNVYAGSYTLATFATAGFTASSGYAFKKWSVGGVEYAEGASITVSAATTVTAVYKTVEEYSLFSGTLVEGDYVICSGTKAMKNETTSSPRIDVADVTVTNNKIIDPDSSIIWHIAKDGDYWTIYNADVEKYAAFTSTNGRGTLIDSVTDYARFSTEDEYEFINVGNSGKYLRYNATYGFASYATSTGVTLTLYKAPSNELSSIALSGEYKTSFASGDTFSFGGTVTANYTIASAANVTSSTTFHLDSADGTNMSGVTMTHAAHDGHTIYAKYTEGGITKTATYEISVANAPVSSVAIGTHAAEIGLEEDYSISGITPTVLPADAVQTTEWVVSANTVSNDYTFNGTKLTAGTTEGTVTLRCRSTADNSKYDELVVTVSGDPTAAFAKDSTSGFAGKNETVSFTYGNFDANDIEIETGNNSYVTIGAISASEGSGTVVINFVAAGSTTVTISDGVSILDTLSVTVTADSVTSVTWSEPSIDVYSGATLSTTGWNVQYEMASGDSGSADSYTIKLGSTTVTAGYAFQGSDDGKTLHVEYGGVSSSSVTITVTQTINNVYADTYTSNKSDLTFTEACGGSGTADDGKEWTVESDGTESTFDSQNGKGIHYGTNSAAVQYIKLTSNDFTSGKITKVEVNASTASSVTATVSVKVGGEAFGGDPQSLTSSAVPNNPYTFTGDVDADEIEVLVTKPSSAAKAIYVKSVVVTFGTSSGSQNIANVVAHKDAQRVAVKYANAFNAAMDETEGCTTGIAAAWSACSDAYDTFKSEAAALGSAEEAYAKNLIKYATAQYRDPLSEDNGNDCIERMMKTYEIMVGRGQTEFMSELVSLSNNLPLSVVNNDNLIIVVTIIALVSITAVGGYFFLKKKKEQ